MKQRAVFNGFVGASGDVLALRPTGQKLGRAVHLAAPAEWEKANKEWLVHPRYRVQIAQLAEEVGLRILPEARLLVGLDPGSPVLIPEMVPRTAWASNVRNHVAQDTWNSARKAVYAAANWRCERCGRRGKQWPIECNELWSYNDDTQTQTLVKLEALCPPCHWAYHLGHSRIAGHFDEALQHLAMVNGWTLEKAAVVADEAGAQWRDRSQHAWNLNLDALRHYGIKPPTTETGDTRAQLSSERVQSIRRSATYIDITDAAVAGRQFELEDILAGRPLDAAPAKRAKPVPRELKKRQPRWRRLLHRPW